jgi:acetyl-CoA synthetase
MPLDLVRKLRDLWTVTPNMPDYAAAAAQFSWERARRDLDGLPSGGINIAHEAVDRHVTAGRANKTALVWVPKTGETQHFTYRDLARLSDRFANLLVSLDLRKGDRVYTLLHRVPELYVTALGAWKAGCVLCPLFSAFGPEPVRARMSLGEAKLLVTTKGLYERKVAGIRDRLPALAHVLLIDDDGPPPAGTASYRALMTTARDSFEIVSTREDDLALLHFTSGTTGTPKGAMHVHGAVVAHHATGRLALDLHDKDIFWCTADPGWVTGTSYGIIAPLTCGATIVIDEEEFDAERWYHILQAQRVTVWYTAPTAIRMLMKIGIELPRRFDLSSLRFMASVGEPLNPEGVLWGLEAIGLPFHDNWWQTETGGIMISNYLSMDIKPGSMGRPLPGIEAAIVRRSDGGIAFIDDPNIEGELALRSGWPSMFRGYLNDDVRYRRSFADGWYLTGDLVRRDEDGYFWFIGRSDDVIKSAGHLIGPFEVESALMEHPAVAEAAVIGVPDSVMMEVVKAFVALKDGYEPSEELRRALLAHARKRLGPAVAPREIDFRPSLPKTRSGKIMRRLLKARELGLPEGDLSMLEGSS